MTEQTDATEVDLAAFAEACAFTCARCRRIGGRLGVDDDKWTLSVERGKPELVCEPCARAQVVAARGAEGGGEDE